MRHHLHQHPELSGHEEGTTRYLAEALEKRGLVPKVVGAGRGLTVDFASSSEAAKMKKFALRGDIDALPIPDGKSVDYRSLNEGVMHACGHDVHATILLSAIEILSEMGKHGLLPWPVSVRGIFQPAEETAEGARYMIHHHALRDVEAIIALHVDPTRGVGHIGLRKGILTAACDIIEVDITGRGGHGARPHLCHDPIDAGAHWIQSAYRMIGRTVEPSETVVLSVGEFKAGNSANVIPNRAMLRGSLRSLDTQSRSIALEMLESVGESVRQLTGCQVDLQLGMSAPAVINNNALVDVLASAAQRVLEPTATEWIGEPSMGSEDFSFYLDHVPGAMFRLGIAGSQIGHAPLHTPNFDVDEGAIEVGAKLMAAAAIEFFSPARSASK